MFLFFFIKFSKEMHIVVIFYESYVYSVNWDVFFNCTSEYNGMHNCLLTNTEHQQICMILDQG